jgi:hypothetical protein
MIIKFFLKGQILDKFNGSDDFSEAKTQPFCLNINTKPL